MKAIVYSHNRARDDIPLVPCIGGMLLDGIFVPLDLDQIDTEAEADVVAGRTYPLDDVLLEMDALIAGWAREAPGG